MGLLYNAVSRNAETTKPMNRVYIGKYPDLMRYCEYKIKVVSTGVLVFNITATKFFGKFVWNPCEWI